MLPGCSSARLSSSWPQIVMAMCWASLASWLCDGLACSSLTGDGISSQLEEQRGKKRTNQAFMCVCVCVFLRLHKGSETFGVVKNLSFLFSRTLEHMELESKINVFPKCFPILECLPSQIPHSHNHSVTVTRNRRPIITMETTLKHVPPPSCPAPPPRGCPQS